MSGSSSEDGNSRRRRPISTKGRLSSKRKLDDEESAEEYDELESSGSVPQKSIEGWILFVRNVHGEAEETDVLDMFLDYGEIRQVELNLDRRTGLAKGCAMVEFAEFDQAKKAVEEVNGKEMLGQPLSVDWAFVKGPRKEKIRSKMSTKIRR